MLSNNLPKWASDHLQTKGLPLEDIVEIDMDPNDPRAEIHCVLKVGLLSLELWLNRVEYPDSPLALINMRDLFSHSRRPYLEVDGADVLFLSYKAGYLRQGGRALQPADLGGCYRCRCPLS